MHVCCCQACPRALCCRLGSVSSAVGQQGTSSDGDPALCRLCRAMHRLCPTLSASSLLAGAQLLLLSLCVPCRPGQHSPCGELGATEGWGRPGVLALTLCFSSHVGPWQRSWGVPKEMALGGRKSSERGSTGGCRVCLSSGGCHAATLLGSGITACVTAVDLPSRPKMDSTAPLSCHLPWPCCSDPVRLQPEGTGHAALPVLPPRTLPGPAGLPVRGVLCRAGEPSLMVCFCRTSWLLGWAKPVRSGMNQRQVRLYVPQRGAWLPVGWHGTAGARALRQARLGWGDTLLGWWDALLCR